ncbi:hypothetical protein GCM10011491_06940 [Brucella endophytica]|uniref:Uncharacterized protein n=1 Tax=Brucella endophytica TaxID=1963359 RepID=A0A916WB81_9HYPH|nr:hypothetical protein GCM10011491_06940 [Brucella endophytica]
MAALDVAFNHPIERTAVEKLVNALGHHPGGVELFRQFAGGALLFQAEIDPRGKILNAVASDAELYDVKWHGTGNKGSMGIRE